MMITFIIINVSVLALIILMERFAGLGKTIYRDWRLWFIHRKR